MVLGITSDNIRLLTKIDDEEMMDRVKDMEGEKILPSFSDQLHKLSSRFRDGKRAR